MKIIEYSDQYRDDMIFMVLEAKNALGRIPHLNEDLLDIQGNYLDKGDPFYLALNEEDRVIGCMGYHAILENDHVRLQRLYVKCSLKRCGIGSALLKTVEQHAIQHGKTRAIVHLGNQDYWESRLFKMALKLAASTPGFIRIFIMMKLQCFGIKESEHEIYPHNQIPTHLVRSRPKAAFRHASHRIGAY